MHYVFGDCELDTTGRELRRAGQPVVLEPRVYEVLFYLIRHRQRIVHKDELLHSVWPAVPVQDNALTRCIRLARRAIGCNAKTQPCITTHYKRGYGFRATVKEEVLSAPAWSSPAVSTLGAELPVTGEAKQATLLCCVIDPAPGRAVDSAPEAYHRLRDQFFVRAFEQILRSAGTILYGEEAGFLALFGAPVTYEDHAQRAVRVALALQGLTFGVSLPGLPMG